MNKWIGIGRLVRDPEIRYSQNENSTAVAKFSLAVDRKFKRQGEADADFFNCVVFGKSAETIEKYLKQGSKILVTGRIENNNYTNKDGQKVYSTQISVDEWEFAESKGSGGGQVDNAIPNPSQANGTVPGSDGFMNIPDGLDSELPFN